MAAARGCRKQTSVEAFEKRISENLLPFFEKKLDQGGMENLVAALSRHPEVSSLNLTGCSLTARAVALFADFLRNQTTLDTVVLRNLSIGEEELKIVLEALSPSTKLALLDLSGVGDPRVDPSPDIIPLVSGWLRANSSIATLDLSGLRQRPSTLRPLAEALQEHPSLTQLDLSHSRLTESLVAELVPAIRANSVLQTLSLSYNEVGDDGVKLLVDALRHTGSSRMRSLFLSSLGIVDKHGAKEIAQLLSTNRSLTHLDISDNRIRKSGGKAILNSLELRNTTLRSLDLSWSLVPAQIEESIQALLQTRSPPT